MEYNDNNKNNDEILCLKVTGDDDKIIEEVKHISTKVEKIGKEMNRAEWIHMIV